MTCIRSTAATMGGFQAIVVEPAAAGANGSATRVYRGGSDHRKDGQAVGW